MPYIRYPALAEQKLVVFGRAAFERLAEFIQPSWKMTIPEKC
jgi:hypothetical protein